MKTLLLGALLFAIPATALAQTPLVVVDGRDVAIYGSSEIDEALLSPAIEEARAYWQSRDTEYEEDVRIMGVAEGAFTHADADELAVLYIMSPWPRCCPKSGIAIIADGRVTANIAFEGTAQTLIALPDIDGDGLTDLGLVGSFGSGGSNTTSLTVASLRDSRVDVWTETIISDDSCGAGYEGRHAAIIEVWEGPTFTGRNLHSSECEGETWDETDGDAYFGESRPDAEEFVFLSRRAD
jgi:hypothetical protein